MKSAPRRILLCVTGLSPQVVTETLYALAVERNPAWIPDEVRLITTTEGAERARLSLLHPTDGQFHRLRADYRLPEIHFRSEHIAVVTDARGLPLDDIRSPEDNESVADFICAQVRELTNDPHSELHVSLAGGRKTMGYYLGYALSLFGRAQDRLSHVLVSEQYESHPKFFYPTPPGAQLIHSREKPEKPLDPSAARVTLADIPFVRLRDGLDQRLLEGRVSFVETVRAAQRSLKKPSLIIDLPGRCIEVMGKRISLPPIQLALYSVFARALLEGRSPLPAPIQGIPDPDWAEPFLREYLLIRNNPMDDTDTVERNYAGGMTSDRFSQIKAKLHSRLYEELGQAAAKPYLIERNDEGFSLSLPPDAVHYQSLPD